MHLQMQKRYNELPGIARCCCSYQVQEQAPLHRLRAWGDLSAPVLPEVHPQDPVCQRVMPPWSAQALCSELVSTHKVRITAAQSLTIRRKSNGCPNCRASSRYHAPTWKLCATHSCSGTPISGVRRVSAPRKSAGGIQKLWCGPRTRLARGRKCRSAGTNRRYPYRHWRQLR